MRQIHVARGAMVALALLSAPGVAGAAGFNPASAPPQQLDGVQIAITKVESSGSSVSIEFRVSNNYPEEKRLFVIADGRYGAVQGSRFHALGRNFQFVDVQVGGQVNRNSPFALVTLPPGLAMEGELRLAGVAVPVEEIRVIDVVASTRSRHSHDRLQFRLPHREA